MRKMIFSLVFIATFALIPLLNAQNPGPQDLVYMCEDIQPSNYVENGVLKGAAVELLRVMWKKMGCPQQPIQVLPWARGYESTLSQDNRVLFATTMIKEREKLFKWVGPIYTIKSVLYGPADAKINIRTLGDAKKYRIGVIKYDVHEIYLKGRGLGSSLESVASLRQNLEKLELKRIDLIAYSVESFTGYLKDNHMDKSRFKVFFVLCESGNYYAFSRNVPDSVIKKFQDALDSSKKEQLEILERYGIKL